MAGSKMRRWLDRGYLIGGVAACVLGFNPPPSTGSAENLAPGTSAFTVRTEDGRIWTGEPAAINIRSELPDGTPAVVEVTFAVTDAKGNIFGVHVELEPDRLLRGLETEWTVSLDYAASIKPGYGVLSYASGQSIAPSTASKGSLSGLIAGRTLQGAFSSNAEGITRGTFGGAYRVRCWVVRQGTAPPDKITGGYVMADDSSFSTPFCSRFSDI
jgi:hypothetical protein